MDHLTETVNPTIGPPRAVDPDRMIGDVANCPLKLLLHSSQVVLQLPTVERCSIVFDTHCNAYRQAYLTQTKQKGRTLVRPPIQQRKCGSGESVNQPLRCLLLTLAAFGYHLLQDNTSTLFIIHLQKGTG